MDLENFSVMTLGSLDFQNEGPGRVPGFSLNYADAFH